MLYESKEFTFIVLIFYSCSVLETIAKLEDYGPIVLCKFQPNSFDCDDKGLSPHRYYYDIKMGDCKSVQFGQCKDNDINSFSSRNECYETCRDAGDKYITENITENIFCRLQPDFGYCHSYHPMWYFDVTQRTCRGFSNSGCGGNLNRFPTSQQCTTTCANAFVY